jgi:hypothetical protein
VYKVSKGSLTELYGLPLQFTRNTHTLQADAVFSNTHVAVKTSRR